MKKEQLRSEAIYGLTACELNGDIESAHGEADNILCELLVKLGFQDVVDAYDRVEKWYA